jgi:hypothetical protein
VEGCQFPVAGYQLPVTGSRFEVSGLKFQVLDCWVEEKFRISRENMLKVKGKPGTKNSWRGLSPPQTKIPSGSDDPNGTKKHQQ